MNPNQRRTANRRKKLSAIYKSPEWKAFKEKCINDAGGKCSWCGSTEALAPHHMLEYSYKTEWDYLDPRNVVVLCKRCHFAVHHGKILCPKCRKNYMRYENNCCYSCLPQADRDRIEAAIEARERKKREMSDVRRRREKDARERAKKHRRDSA